MGSKFSIFAPRILLICQPISKRFEIATKSNVPTCVDGHLRLRRILPDGRTRDPGTTARRIAWAQVNTENELAGNAAR
jgi:hypothetical protein